MSCFFQGVDVLTKRFVATSVFVGAVFLLAGCGSGAVSNDSVVAANGTPTLAITLTELTSATARTSISFVSPAKVNATFKTATGIPISGVVVRFTTDATFGVFSPVSGTALTDATGLATVILNSASFSASGASSITVTGQVGTGTTATTLTQTLSYSVGAANVTLSPIVVQTPVLSAFGTTGISVTVSAGGAAVATPLEVKFTSPCASNGRAALTASTTTVNGVANATYRDIGCASMDTITATVSGTTISSSGTVTISAPAVGSIQFVSALPTSISLRGTGGAGRQETSLVTFKVVDVAGNPIGGKLVSFTLNTSVGGITLTPTSATSDATTGLVVTNIQSGSVSTPVRVTAQTVAGTQMIATQSDQLTISTGMPSQGGFSLSVSTLNIEGGEIDGTTTQVTARLADRFSNPVPDGTAVNFTAAGGSIISSCTTIAGACSSTLSSQNFRTTNGRIAILAYAIGEESFTDKNGNGWFDIGELVDLNNDSTDLPEAWLDVNEDRVRNTNEPFIDFNNNGNYDGRDGKFNGVSCDDLTVGRSVPGSCGSPKSVHVRGHAVVIFSGSNPRFTTNATLVANVPTIGLTPCSVSSTFVKESKTVQLTIRDSKGNVMPAGTAISFATSNGVIVSSPTSFIVPNTAAMASTFDNVTGTDGAVNFAVTVESDASQTVTPATATTPEVMACTNTRSSGALTATVRTPSGLTTSFSIDVKD